MAAFAFGLLGVGITKFSIKQIIKPRKKMVVKIDPPYETLCISAILSKLAYKSLTDFRSSAREVTDKYPSLKRQFEKIIFEKDEDLVLFDAAKKTCEDMTLPDEVKVDCQDTQVFIWLREKNVYVVFRGTDSKNDVLADLDVRRINFGKESGVLIHRGFLNQFNAIESNLTAFLEEHRHEYTHITFTGHSLGMACSIIASIFYEEYFMRVYGSMSGSDTPTNIPIIHCHGFGGPRVGNHKFAEYYSRHKRLNDNTWQIKDFEDVVTMIPFSHRFCHVPSPTLSFYKANVRYTNDKKDNPWYIRPLLILTKMNLFNIPAAHSLDKYIKTVLRHYEIQINR